MKFSVRDLVRLSRTAPPATRARATPRRRRLPPAACRRHHERGRRHPGHRKRSCSKHRLPSSIAALITSGCGTSGGRHRRGRRDRRHRKRERVGFAVGGDLAGDGLRRTGGREEHLRGTGGEGQRDEAAEGSAKGPDLVRDQPRIHRLVGSWARAHRRLQRVVTAVSDQQMPLARECALRRPP